MIGMSCVANYVMSPRAKVTFFVFFLSLRKILPRKILPLHLPACLLT